MLQCKASLCKILNVSVCICVRENLPSSVQSNVLWKVKAIGICWDRRGLEFSRGLLLEFCRQRIWNHMNLLDRSWWNASSWATRPWGRPDWYARGPVTLECHSASCFVNMYAPSNNFALSAWQEREISFFIYFVWETKVPTVWAIDQYRIYKEVLERSMTNVDGVQVSLMRKCLHIKSKRCLLIFKKKNCTIPVRFRSVCGTHSEITRRTEGLRMGGRMWYCCASRWATATLSCTARACGSPRSAGFVQRLQWSSWDARMTFASCAGTPRTWPTAGPVHSFDQHGSATWSCRSRLAPWQRSLAFPTMRPQCSPITESTRSSRMPLEPHLSAAGISAFGWPI